MNKLRRRYNQISFPSVDKKTAHKKGTLSGNMMGYDAKPEPTTSHLKGSMPGNMMQYSSARAPSSYPPISDESKNYGPKPLTEPTRSGFGKKVLPPQMKEYIGYKPDNPEWTQIGVIAKKKGSFYGN